MHRTQSEFDDNLTFKVFIFQFINFYSSIFYIAFFKGRFVGYPGRYNYIFGTLRNEDVSNIWELITNIGGKMCPLSCIKIVFWFQCSNGGCLIELAQQLAVIMIGKQMINNAQEILFPKIQAWWHSKKVRYECHVLNFYFTRLLIYFGCTWSNPNSLPERDAK